MFWFRHPKPFHRKEVAMQMASRKAVAPPGTTSIIVDLPPDDMPELRAAAGGDNGTDALRFSVRYRLPEYLSFLHEHVLSMIRTGAMFNPLRHAKISLALAGLLAVLALGGRASAAHGLSLWSGVGALLALAYAAVNTGPGLKLQTALFCTPVFLIKRHYMPECRFTIDAAGIERETARGTMLVRWDEIVSVRTYSPGYLLMTTRGGLPIPLRSLSPAQASRLRALVAARRARQSVASGADAGAERQPGSTAPA